MLLDGRPSTVLVDQIPTPIWMIFVGNCAHDPPGFAPATRTRLDDGYFDVRLVDGNQPAARLRLLLAVRTGQLSRSPVYQRRLVTELEVATGEWTTTLTADGETFPGRGRFVITKHPKPLLVHVPQR